VSLIQVTYRMF